MKVRISDICTNEEIITYSLFLTNSEVYLSVQDYFEEAWRNAVEADLVHAEYIEDYRFEIVAE